MRPSHRALVMSFALVGQLATILAGNSSAAPITGNLVATSGHAAAGVPSDGACPGGFIIQNLSGPGFFFPSLTAELSGFRRNPQRAHARARRMVCIGCEITGRTEEKYQNRFLAKARSTLARHAAKKGLKPKEFADRYGWAVPRMAHDDEHAYGNGCHYCGTKFLTMGHGLADITLDVVDPREEPYYATNTRWVCGTCNRQKSSMPPGLWSRRLKFWRDWKSNRETRSRNPWAGLPLVASLWGQTA